MLIQRAYSQLLKTTESDLKHPKTKHWFKNTISMLSISWGLMYKPRLCRKIQNMAHLAYSDSWSPPNPKWFQLKAFSGGSFVSLRLQNRYSRNYFTVWSTEYSNSLGRCMMLCWVSILKSIWFSKSSAKTGVKKLIYKVVMSFVLLVTYKNKIRTCKGSYALWLWFWCV